MYVLGNSDLSNDASGKSPKKPHHYSSRGGKSPQKLSSHYSQIVSVQQNSSCSGVTTDDVGGGGAESAESSRKVHAVKPGRKHSNSSENAAKNCEGEQQKRKDDSDALSRSGKTKQKIVKPDDINIKSFIESS